MFLLYLANIWHSVRILFSKDRELYDEIRSLTGIYPRNVMLYQCAFTHRSVLKRRICAEYNERLEYLGDAVLGSIIASYLYKCFPYHKEGMLTKMRAKLVNRITLNKIARQHRLDRFLISQVNLRIEGKYIYSNMVEALVGAVYLDLGYNYAEKFVLKVLFGDYLNDINLEETEYDYKSRILEWGQKSKLNIDFVSKPSNDPGTGRQIFDSNIFIDGKVEGHGVGKSKKEAEQNAAKSIWEKWNRN